MDLRVLQVLAASAGGIARHVAQLTAALDEGPGVCDIAGVRPPITLPKDIIEVDIPAGVFGHSAARARLREIITDGRYDVVHAHGLRAAVDAAVAAPQPVPVIATVHNLVRGEVAGRWKAPIHRRAEWLVLRLCDKVFAVSEEIARELQSRSPRHASKVEVLYLGIGPTPAVRRPRAEVRAELGAEDAPLVLTASRLAPQKALHVFLAALAELDDSAVGAVAGTGPSEAELKGLAARLGLSQRVRWLGFREDVHDLIAAADVFCLSSTWEGVPLAAQEAILLGTPVVATAVGGMPELIRNGASGRLVPPNDPRALGAALKEVLESAELRARFVENARADLENRFSTAAMLHRLEQAYAEAAVAP